MAAQGHLSNLLQVSTTRGRCLHPVLSHASATRKYHLFGSQTIFHPSAPSLVIHTEFQRIQRICRPCPSFRSAEESYKPIPLQVNILLPCKSFARLQAGRGPLATHEEIVDRLEH